MLPSAQSAERAELLGARVDLVTADEVLAFVGASADAGRKAVIANHNLHSLHLVRTNPEMAELFERADLIEIDSMPLILWGQLMGAKMSAANRSTYLDWRDQFWSAAQARGWRVFYLGAEPGVAEAAARRIRSQWPDVEIAVRHGYFDHATGSAENEAVVAEINAFAPHVLLVGMGMPLQEVWIARNFDALKTGVVLPVGGAFDYEAGVQVAAPRFLGAMGLEWMFRLASQPRRLFRRYMIEPWKLIEPALKDVERRMGGRPVRSHQRLIAPGNPAAALAAPSQGRPAPMAA